MTDQAVIGDTSAWRARPCRAVGVSQAGYYRRHRQSPSTPEPVPQTVNSPAADPLKSPTLEQQVWPSYHEGR